MSKLNATLELDVPRETAEQACQAALTDLGWQSAASGIGFVGREDPARLPCHESPASTRLLVRSVAGIRPIQVVIQIKVPGVGPISSQHAGVCSRTLARAIHLHATRR